MPNEHVDCERAFSRFRIPNLFGSVFRSSVGISSGLSASIWYGGTWQCCEAVADCQIQCSAADTAAGASKERPPRHANDDPSTSPTLCNKRSPLHKQFRVYVGYCPHSVTVG